MIKLKKSTTMSLLPMRSLEIKRREENMTNVVKVVLIKIKVAGMIHLISLVVEVVVKELVLV